MPEQRRKFSPQFRAEAVQMVIETGKPIAEVARDLGVNHGTLGNWVKAFRDANPEPGETALSPVERARVSEMEAEIPPVADGERVPEQSSGLLRQDAAVAERCAVIEAEKANYKIAWMCRLLRLPRSSFCAWLARTETPGAARRRQLGVEVVRVFAFGRSAFGCRRVASQLNREGHECSIGLVADLMRELGLAAVQPRAYKRTTTRGEDPHDSPDLIGRDFAPGPDGGPPGSRLVGDITYLKTGEGWLYLATVIDLATRMVVGWQLAPHMRTTLIVDALDMARAGGHVRRDAIFHSDRGTQYTSKEFHQYCQRIGVRTSVGRTGVCWDNAVAESFFSALKNEMFHHQHFPTRARARFAVADYIEVFYNRRRLHSTLGYRTPFEALAELNTEATAA